MLIRSCQGSLVEAQRTINSMYLRDNYVSESAHVEEA